MADPDTLAETPVPPAPLPPAPVRRRSGGALWLVLGGVVAAGLGFGLAQVLPMPPADAALATEVQALKSQTEALKAQIDGLPAPDAGLADRIAALESRPASPDLTARIEALEARINTLAAQPGSVDAAALKAVQDQIAALSARPETVPAEVDAAVQAAKDQLAQATAAAEAKTRATIATSALHEVAAALDSGAPFAAALAALPADSVPQALTDAAATGLPTLQDLRTAFPDAARTALEAARRADMGSSWTDRIGTFLQTQTGARSLSPREGNDPDAILSRAEDALRSGDLPAALTEVSALPDAAKPALADWAALAQRRLDGQAALAALAKTVGQ